MYTKSKQMQLFYEIFKYFCFSVRLDAIIAHSSAIYPALRLSLDPEIEIRSQVFFNTGGHKRTMYV